MTFLSATYDPWFVAASLLIATFSSYVALDLAKRVRTHDRSVAKSWWIGGSIAMGTGIWCMHFVGMLAFSLPIALGYGAGMTALSWCAAVAASAIALQVASTGSLTWRRLTAGAVAMGAGVTAMHYIGMSALDMAPGIVWNIRWVAASVAIAVGASAAALRMFFWLRGLVGRRGHWYQSAAALAMGVAVCATHYSGMAAASFSAGTICLSAHGLSGERLGLLVSLFSLGLLVMTLLTSILDARMQHSLNLANLQLQTANEELHRRAFMDALTGLPNRLLFEDRLLQALQRSERLGKESGRHGAGKLAVLFVDLDGFKPVNDSFGHAAGDQVLREVARRLQATARESDTVARIGGDEFLVLMEDVVAADCASLANRILGEAARAYTYGERQVAISASVGIVLFPDDGQRDKLIAQADAAMYAVKRAGGHGHAFFESHMDGAARDQLSLQTDLRLAIERDQLQLHYQPKVGGVTGHIHGVEALLRWTHPERGDVSPAIFIPIAERLGLINALGHWVIEEACRQMNVWADSGLRMRVAINLSVHQLREEDIVQRVDRALRRHMIESSQLLCEITESVAMEDIKRTQRTFEGFGRIGVFLSIDDFGTGYSSLSYLRQLPASQLKVDRSFVADLETSKDARAIVSAVVRLAHELGLRVVAEGVETEGQRAILVALGCDELQGFFLARPMSARALQDWVDGRKPAGAADFAPSVIGVEA